MMHPTKKPMENPIYRNIKHSLNIIAHRPHENLNPYGLCGLVFSDVSAEAIYDAGRGLLYYEEVRANEA